MSPLHRSYPRRASSRQRARAAGGHAEGWKGALWLPIAVSLVACGAPTRGRSEVGTDSAAATAPADAPRADRSAADDARNLDLPNSPRDSAPDTLTLPPQGPPALTAADPAAAELLQQGRLAEAHALIGRHLLEANLERARAALAAAEPEEALVSLDEALKFAPNDPRIHYLRGIGLLNSLDAAVARGNAGGLIADYPTDALQSLARCPPNAATEHASAHAAWLSGAWQSALQHARAAQTAPDDAAYPWLLSLPAERVRFDAWSLALRQARAGAAPGTDPAELLEACRAEIGTLISLDPLAAWPWRALSDLEEQAGQREEAVAVLERAIARQPDQAALWNEWRARSHALHGVAGSADRAAALAELHPQTGAALLVAGQTRFDAALERLGTEPNGARADFRAALELLKSARESTPEFSDAARQFEVVCTGGAGWAALALGRSDEAEALFRSMADVLPNGCEWKVEGKLGSGIEGLDAIGRELARRWEETRELAVLERAAAIYAFLHEARPDISAWSNNAGFFQRDLASELSQRAARFCAAARGEAPSPERAAELRAWAPAQELEFVSAEGRAGLRELADRHGSRAVELMRRSWNSYAAAVTQAPDDVRTLNDAALIQVYHLHDELDRAEQWLQHCIALGASQLADAALSERARYELKNAWGDAHQNLGVLLLVHRRDPIRAREWFEKALAIGPDPRPLISAGFLPACADGAAIAQLPEADEILRWGAPCAP
jgi:tetratricopeptide (TPR) repeat protein